MGKKIRQFQAVGAAGGRIKKTTPTCNDFEVDLKNGLVRAREP